MHYVVSVPFDPKLAEFIGKKGSENSITFYNRKIEDNVIVALAPTSILEKFYAVAESMLLSSEIIVSTADIDKLFGEIVVACSLLNKHVVFTKESNIDKFLNSIKINSVEFVEREDILHRILSHKPDYASDSVRIDIDKAFPVKGLGTILLGIVTKGTVKVHDELFHSSGKKVSIRSMQSQDMDMTEAKTGTRVGLAIKGMEHEEFEKGDVLIGLSGSGNSKNVLNAVTYANDHGGITIGWTGMGGGKLSKIAKLNITVPDTDIKASPPVPNGGLDDRMQLAENFHVVLMHALIVAFRRSE